MENSNHSTEKTTVLPLVALIGPTNAGKSTLFNRLTGSWQAVTAREEATTRDRVYGEVEWQNSFFTVIDTGGLVDDDSELNQRVFKQMEHAASEADLILFVYDAASGLHLQHKEYLDRLRGKNVWLIANKIDSWQREKKVERLPNVGFPYHEVSALSGRGVGDLLEEIVHAIPRAKAVEREEPLIALVGRPNVGKSTLLNALTQSNRAVVSPVAGTTRDIVTADLSIDEKPFLLADTAGVRRRGKIEAGAEKFSVKRTLAAIAQADAVVVLVDATAGTARGDLHLIYYANELKKPVLVVYNKSDLMEPGKSIPFHKHVGRFEHVIISALHEDGINQVTDWIKKQDKLAKTN